MSYLGQTKDELVELAFGLFSDATVRAAPLLQDVHLEPGEDLTESRHLQPLFKQELQAVAAKARPRAEVSPSLGTGLKKLWPRLGNFDISLAWRKATVYGELKCGADEGTLSACGWDAAKCTFALNNGKGEATVLVAAAPETMWRAGALGTELLLGGDWDMKDIRKRYIKGFRKWEKDGYKPNWVFRRFGTRELHRAAFESKGKAWLLVVAAVEPRGDERLDWPSTLL